nr:hypothetical protein [Tanacetum cinerariifolium]
MLGLQVISSGPLILVFVPWTNGGSGDTKVAFGYLWSRVKVERDGFVCGCIGRGREEGLIVLPPFKPKPNFPNSLQMRQKQQLLHRQQHTEQLEFNNEGEVDQNAEECHDT